MQPTDYSIVLRYLDEPDHAVHKAEFENWLKKSDANKAFYEELRMLWEQSAAAATYEGVDATAATERFAALLHQHYPATVAALPRNKRWWRYSAAAATIAAAALAWWLLRPTQVRYNTFTTTSRIDSLLLSDGSKVILNKHSSLRYPAAFGSRSRQVFLDSGTAFFEVQASAVHPFAVTAGDTKVSVLGTAFNLASGQEEIKLYVLSGEVAFGSNTSTASPIRLKAGSGASFHKKTGQLGMDADVDYNQLAWRTRELYFRDTPMEEVCAVLSEHYQVRVILENDARKTQKLNANFSHKTIDEILETLNALYNYRFEKRGDTIYIR